MIDDITPSPEHARSTFDANTRHRLIAGERRWRAAQIASVTRTDAACGARPTPP